MKLLLLSLISASVLLHGQDFEPTAPDQDSGGGGGSKSMDLSKLPKRAPDPSKKPELTPEEKALEPVQLFVFPVGAIPPPIIYLDEKGMPRERYRDPMEYAPTVYHVKTEKATLRLLGSQNQVGPPISIPRKSTLEFLYEVPPDPPKEGVVAVAKKEKELRAIDTLPFPEGATHLVAVVWKEASAELWNQPRVELIDISPTPTSASEAAVINLSGTDLGVFRGEKSRKLSPGFVGKLQLPTNEDGQVPLVLAANKASRWQRLSQTVANTRQNEQLFLVTWAEEPSEGSPLGIASVVLTKRLTSPRPFR